MEPPEIKAHLREHLKQKPQSLVPVAFAPRETLGDVLTRAPWNGVSTSEDTDPEADGRDTMKGFKDWITASDAAF